MLKPTKLTLGNFFTDRDFLHTSLKESFFRKSKLYIQDFIKWCAKSPESVGKVPKHRMLIDMVRFFLNNTRKSVSW